MTKQFKDPGQIKFKAIIKRSIDYANSGAWIEFPYNLKDTYGVGNLVPIKATFDNKAIYQGSLAKMGGPDAIIVLRKDIRTQIGKQPGDTVDVTIELDNKPRQLDVPNELISALKRADLLDDFQGMAFSHRREYVQYIKEAKKPETRLKRIEKSVAMIADKHKS